ncbi:hypothetical protein K2224_14575 [Streptomyces sp. BHT-5-2]|uniref:hypothetical protein n=1 Tax=unclassified Streptomyces TaxID=2593676 RepID=UPI001C8DFCC6|nr:hypothetical protein [Streptomyces sp. BHT-5-2]QZL04259.1 hypothetical protein K2224_14575 [Streptomyces sp. BHT-5-2]
MTERNVSNLRAGQRVRAAVGIKYLADEADDVTSVEAVEFLPDAGPSILLSCGTDWTLQISEGRWPVLPAWCWPAESWAFEKLDQIGSPGLDRIISTSDIRNSVGEICGILLEFPAAWVTVRSGEALTWSISRKE